MSTQATVMEFEVEESGIMVTDRSCVCGGIIARKDRKSLWQCCTCNSIFDMALEKGRKSE